MFRSLIKECITLLLMVSEILCLVTKCPDPTLFQPCNCIEHWMTGVEIDCSAVKSNEELANAFSSLAAEDEFGKLTIESNYDLTTIRAGDFGKASFTEISITHGYFNDIEPLAFAGSYLSVEKIYIKSNRLVSFPFEELPKFSALTLLTVSHNHFDSFPTIESDTLEILVFGYNNIGSLPDDALRGVPKLRQINIDSCGLTSIPQGTFTGFPNLELVTLSGNNIKTLRAGTIELHANESFLLLTKTGLEEIEAGAFTGVTTQLDATFNGLTLMPEDVYRPTIENGASLLLRKNPFICGCDMAWLILNSTLLERVNYETACEDGTELEDLDPILFEDC